MANHPPSIPSEEELQKLPATGGGYWNRLVFQKSHYLPNTVWLAVSDHDRSAINWFAPFTTGFASDDLTLYRCKSFVCELPIRGCDNILARLKELVTNSSVAGPRR